MAKYHPEIHRFSSMLEASKKLAEFIVKSCSTEIHEKGYFTMVLSGGSTPRMLYEMLGQSPYAEAIPWQKIYLFWGDDRCVAKSHKHSNFKMVHSLLLTKIAIPAANVIHMEGGTENPEKTAERYEELIADFFKTKGVAISSGNGFPSFDFLLQGMGSDGHTASLFPNDPTLQEKHKWVVGMSESPTEPILPRITFTLPVINNGKKVVFLIAGKEKTQLMDLILENYREASMNFPAAMVNPTGELYWYAVS